MTKRHDQARETIRALREEIRALRRELNEAGWWKKRMWLERSKRIAVEERLKEIRSICGKRFPSRRLD